MPKYLNEHEKMKQFETKVTLINKVTKRMASH